MMATCVEQGASDDACISAVRAPCLQGREVELPKYPDAARFPR